MAVRQNVNGNRVVAERNGNGTNTWQVVIMAGAVMLTLASQFWSLANPRDDIKQIRDELKTSINVIDARLQDDIKQIRSDLVKEIAKNEAELADTRFRLSDTVDKQRHEVIDRREHDEYVKREDARITLLEAQAVKLQDVLVPRAEHASHWSDADQKFTVLNARLDNLITQIAGTVTIGDQLKNLQKEIDDLRASQAGVHANVTWGPSTSTLTAPTSHN